MEKQNLSRYIWFPLTLLIITFILQTVATATALEDDKGVNGEITSSVSVSSDPPPSSVDPCSLETVVCEGEINWKVEKIYAYVTGYNTIVEQTDSSPCYAGGRYICGRTDTSTCPRRYPIGSRVIVRGMDYECLDRTAAKYDERIDINCDKDFACPYKVTGWQWVTIKY